MAIAVLATPAQANTPLSLTIGVTTDASCSPGLPDTILVAAGTEVTFCYTMTNTTIEDITFHTLQSSEYGTIINNQSTPVLSPGESFVITRDANEIVSPVANTTTWTAEDQSAIEYSGTDTAFVNVCPTIPTTLFVKSLSTVPVPDGLSWTTAFKGLQPALDAARTCSNFDEIRIADGTYKPTGFDGDRHITFDIPEGVTVVGAYAPNGSTNPSPLQYESILSGDLNGNDNANITLTEPTRSDNSLTVVTLANSGVTLRNLTITSGNSDAPSGSPIPDRSGGGIYAATAAQNPVLDNLLIKDSAADDGGGIYISRGELINSQVSNNRARIGGGIRLLGSAEITNVVVNDNYGNIGGGIYGGSSAPITNVLIVDNEGVLGAGYYVSSTNQLKVVNATIVGNDASSSSGGLGGVLNLSGTLEVTNSIIRDNTAATDPNIGSGNSPVTVEYSNITGGFPGTGNIDADPVFIDAMNGDYTLTHLSPSQNTGDNSVVTEPFDLAGEPRIQLGVVDMGAFETAAPDARGFVTLDRPCTILDTALTPDGALDGLEKRTISATGLVPSGQGGDTGSTCIPDGVTSAMVTVTAFPFTNGNLRLSPAGIAPAGGVVNYQNNGLYNSNTVTTEISLDGELDVFANSPTALGAPAANVRIDVVGYHPDSGGDGFTSITPCAVADTRPSQGPAATFLGPFYAFSTLPDIDVVGTFPAGQGGGNTDCGIPATATSVVLNVVSIQGDGGRGLVSVATADGIDPTDPQVRFAPIGQNNAAIAVVPLDGGEDVSVRIYSLDGGSVNTHIRLVAVGYYTSIGGLDYVPITACAAFDTRSATGAAFTGKRLGASTTTFDLVGSGNEPQGGLDDCGVPTDAGTVLINNVAIQAEYPGNFQAFATGTSPTGGILNFAPLAPAMNNSNAVPIPLSGSGQMDLFTNTNAAGTNQPAVHARGVVLGYFE